LESLFKKITIKPTVWTGIESPTQNSKPNPPLVELRDREFDVDAVELQL
jgi:hypothetical protein